MYDYSAMMGDSMSQLAWMYPVSGVFAIIGIIAMWKLFSKAGQPGWAAIIPIYNLIVLLRIVNRPWWWLLLMLVPFVNIVIAFIVIFDLGKSFGKSGVWSFFLLIVLSVIGILILAFGKSQYKRIER